MAKIILALAFASLVSAAEFTAEEKKQEELAEKLVSEQGAEAQAMKAQLEAQLQQFVKASEEKDKADMENRQKRWASILHKQQQSLIQHEQTLKTEEKDLQKMQREKEWKKSEAAKSQTEESSDACAGQQSSVRAFISASDSHATCLKGQLGACIATEVTSTMNLKCDDHMPTWQKKCLADKAQEMADCAPLGVDWNAMRRGEKGIEADNAALQRLGEWCNFHRSLGKIGKDMGEGATQPLSLILSKDAALSKNAVQKLSDFGENFKQQEWDLLQVDPIGTPAPLHSVLVKTESAEKLQSAMSQMKAVPLDMMPKAVNDAGAAKAVSWTAGVSGMLEKESSDCSLQSPALLQVKDDKLVAALR